MLNKSVTGRSSGSAMTECIFLLFIMVPMMFIIPMLGKITDLKQTATSASRYSAWENTVNTGASQGAQLQARFFSKSASPLSTSHAQVDENELWGQNAGTDRSNHDVSISIDRAALRASTSEVGGLGATGSVGSMVEDVGNLLDFGSSTEWGLTGRGLVKSQVEIDVQQNDFLTQHFSTCNGNSDSFGCLHADNAIMIDGWSASGDSQSADRTRSLVPATALRPLGDALSLFGVIPVLDELDSLDDAFGYVNTRPLPTSEQTTMQRYQSDQP